MESCPVSSKLDRAYFSWKPVVFLGSDTDNTDKGKPIKCGKRLEKGYRNFQKHPFAYLPRSKFLSFRRNVGFAERFQDIALQLARFTQVDSMAKTGFILASPSHPIYVYKNKHTNTHIQWMVKKSCTIKRMVETHK